MSGWTVKATHIKKGPLAPDAGTFVSVVEVALAMDELAALETSLPGGQAPAWHVFFSADEAERLANELIKSVRQLAR